MKASPLVETLAAAAAVALIAIARPHAAAIADRVAEVSDSYDLPPNRVLPEVSLGYRSALADLIWAHVLVTQGLRMEAHRPFDYVVQYMDAISTLDPGFRDPYRLADTLIAYQSNDPNKVENVRQARRVMEFGLKQFPLDTELWLDYGQFLAYVAPSVITDPKEQVQWRADGAKALAHVVELGAADPAALFKSVAAVRFMIDHGENEAAIRMLEKAYAVTDDPDTREQIELKLKRLLGTRAESQRLLLTRKFDELWRNDLPFVSHTEMSALGPPVNVWMCAGLGSPDPAVTRPCDRDWNSWAASLLGESGP